MFNQSILDTRDKSDGNDTLSLGILLEKIHRDGGYDFREYKCGTVIRRLQRRLHATGSKTYREYMSFLDACPDEYEMLAEDIAIKVSSFFRSEYSFQQVNELVLPELIAAKRLRKQHSLRFWSTACTRGEEPYSIAMLLHRFFENEACDFDVSIYASDISRRSLQEAQFGEYSGKDIAALRPAILNDYFRHRGEKYIIADEIKRMVSFCRFNLTSAESPPFSNLDCIFCCNILIYLQRSLQSRVLDMLYNALATPGYLVLGEAETLTNNLSNKMECLDAKAKIYKKNGG